MKNINCVSKMSRITEKAHRLIIRELEAHDIQGLVPSHGGILSLLFTGEVYTMNDLAQKIHRTKPTLTVLVDKLTALGYVKKEKSPKDSRVTLIQLTEAGAALQPSFEAVSQKMNEVVYQGLTVSELGQLENLLERIQKNLKE